MNVKLYSPVFQRIPKKGISLTTNQSAMLSKQQRLHSLKPQVGIVSMKFPAIFSTSLNKLDSMTIEKTIELDEDMLDKHVIQLLKNVGRLTLSFN